MLLELRFESLGDSVGSRVDVSSEENGETLLLLSRVRFSENLDDSLVREPIRNGLSIVELAQFWTSEVELSEEAYSTSLESSTKFGSRDIGGDSSLGNLIDGHVDVLIGNVRHHLERNLTESRVISEKNADIRKLQNSPFRFRVRP